MGASWWWLHRSGRAMQSVQRYAPVCNRSKSRWVPVIAMAMLAQGWCTKLEDLMTNGIKRAFLYVQPLIVQALCFVTRYVSRKHG